MKDAFDQWCEWTTEAFDSPRIILAEIHNAVMALPPDERKDRDKVNAAVRDGLELSDLRPAGSADEFDVPKAEQ